LTATSIHFKWFFDFDTDDRLTLYAFF